MLVTRVEPAKRDQYTVSPHRHEDVEWHFILAGRCEFTLDDATTAIAAGDLLVIPRGRMHRIRMGSPGDFIIQTILGTVPEDADDQALIDAVLARAEHAVLRIGTGRQGAIRAIAQDAAASDRFARLGAAHRFCALLCGIVNGFSPEVHPGVARAISFMEGALPRPITLDAIVRRSGLRRSTLAKRFRAEFGESPVTYYRNLRLDMAAEMLRLDTRPVSEVAARCGFEDQFHFSRLFTRRHRRSPTRFRSGFNPG